MVNGVILTQVEKEKLIKKQTLLGAEIHNTS